MKTNFMNNLKLNLLMIDCSRYTTTNIVCHAIPLLQTFQSMLKPTDDHPKSFADHTQSSVSLNNVSIVVRNVILSRIQNTMIHRGKHANIDQQLLMTIGLISNIFWTCVINEVMSGVMRYKYG